MSANYTEVKGDGIIEPSFVVDGWAVKVKMPYFTVTCGWEGEICKFHKDKVGTVGYVFDRKWDDMRGFVGDMFWTGNSCNYLFKTKEEAVDAYWKFFENHRKEWEKWGITHEMVYLGVYHIRHEQTIKVIEKE